MKKFFITLLIFMLLHVSMKASTTNYSPDGESGITMYGFCLGTRTGLSVQRGAISFNSSDPTLMTNIDRDDYSYLLAGEYLDGKWYVLVYDSTEEGLLPNALVTVDMETGERTHIADITQDIIMWDMTYNYVTKTMYGVAIDTEASTTMLYTIDLTTAAFDEVGIIEGDTEYYVTLACDRSGEMYSIGSDGNLYKLDIAQEEENTVSSSLIGSLGLDKEYSPEYYQSMTFDRATDILYWGSGCDGSYFEFHTIDLRTGLANHVGRLGPDEERGIQMTNLVTPYEDLNPKAHSGFDMASANAGASGELYVDLVFQPNFSTIDGEPYQSFSSPIGTLYIYRDDFSGEPVHIQENQIPMFGMWVDETVSAGWHRYKIIVVNDETGPGVPRYLRVYVGEDIPNPVSNIELSYDEENNKLRLTWEAPLAGINGGWIDSENLTYSIVRYPGGIEVASDYAGTEYEEEVGYETGYYYAVKAISSVGEGETVTSNMLVAGLPYQLPWSEDFDTEGVDITWQKAPGFIESNWSQAYEYGIASSASMDHFFREGASQWMFSPKIMLEAGKSYRLSWYDKSSSPNNYNITIGKDKTPEGHTRVLKSIEMNNNYYLERDIWFDVPEDGSYSIGWYGKSGEDAYSLYVDNVSVEEAFDVDLAVAYLKGNPAPIQGKGNSYLVTVKNNGLNNAGNFDVSLIDENSNELVSSTYQGTLEPGASDVVELTWTPAETGNMTVKGIATISNDGRNTNNQSKGINTKVQPSEVEVVTVVSGETTSFLMPFNLAAGNSCTQALYFEDEIKKSGEINAIEFTNRFTSTYVYDRPMKVYISVVDVEEITEWIRPNEETDLYFDGVADFLQGKNTVTILLDRTFNYTGGVLLITTMVPQNESNSFNDLFMTSKLTGKDNRTYVTMSNMPFNWDNFFGASTTAVPNLNLVMKPTGTNISSPQAATTLILAYPNPTNGEVNLMNYSNDSGAVKVYDLTGKLMMEANRPKFSISHLSNGVYIVKVAGQTFKLIKE